MATVIFANEAGKYQDDAARHDLIHYINQSKKTPNRIVGSTHGDISQAADRMTQTSRSFGKDQGVRVYHFIISFAPGDVRGLEYIICAANEILRQLGQNYEAVYAVHEDTQLPHIHFVFNPVSYVDGHKYHGSKQEYHELMDMLRDVMRFIGVYQFFRGKKGSHPDEAD